MAAPIEPTSAWDKSSSRCQSEKNTLFLRDFADSADGKLISRLPTGKDMTTSTVLDTSDGKSENGTSENIWEYKMSDLSISSDGTPKPGARLVSNAHETLEDLERMADLLDEQGILFSTRVTSRSTEKGHGSLKKDRGKEWKRPERACPQPKTKLCGSPAPAKPSLAGKEQERREYKKWRWLVPLLSCMGGMPFQVYDKQASSSTI